MLSNHELTKLKTQLHVSRDDLKNRLRDNGDLDLRRSHYHDSTGELSSYDNHPGDGATELYEREKDLALYQHYQNEVQDIDNALQAIKDGSYGKCRECGKEIPFERLEALPTTLFCVEHTPSQETSHNRPVEEEVLMPPFGQFDLDEKNENVAYDAEDSWQDVASYGTSETPSDLTVPTGHYNDMYEESEENVGYVEDYENFVGVDIEGKNITVYPNSQHEKYEKELDEEGIMTTFGDLPANEHDPYVEED
ncbi:yteA family sporulation protein [Peribacillus cavernae]|uniref:YteA family sporulation protein n=1 Tax=Peribacillus cavernae TaxID=1674310 RepID=A0A3S0VV17_9BACI|nr:TraR/DksA C4-type zinc finger protein [Peribacillus cavernae]MDQ0219621.1 YteA family regulatory protein [Peribacillus cavernae]RUQ25908.1 yteA family sporulation protein [Peribacillus cavernae]